MLTNYFNINSNNVKILNEAQKFSLSNENKVQEKPLLNNNISKRIIERSIKNYIFTLMKKEESLNWNQKLEFSNFFLENLVLLSEDAINELLEEEFHYSIMNWIIRAMYVINNYYIVNDLSNFYAIMHLLVNVIKILDKLPIKASELIELNLYKNHFYRQYTYNNKIFL